MQCGHQTVPTKNDVCFNVVVVCFVSNGLTKQNNFGMAHHADILSSHVAPQMTVVLKETSVNFVYKID